MGQHGGWDEGGAVRHALRLSTPLSARVYRDFQFGMCSTSHPDSHVTSLEVWHGPTRPFIEAASRKEAIATTCPS